MLVASWSFRLLHQTTFVDREITFVDHQYTFRWSRDYFREHRDYFRWSPIHFSLITKLLSLITKLLSWHFTFTVGRHHFNIIFAIFTSRSLHHHRRRMLTTTSTWSTLVTLMNVQVVILIQWRSWWCDRLDFKVHVVKCLKCSIKLTFTSSAHHHSSSSLIIIVTLTWSTLLTWSDH